MRGHGENPPHPQWPGGANVAVQFVVNYEEGGENSILHGDKASEAFLSEITGAVPWEGMRHWNMESIYEYGARAGFWRVRRAFEDAGIKPTVYGVATALMRSPEQSEAMLASGWDMASHGLKWIDYRNHSREAGIGRHCRGHPHPPRGDRRTSDRMVYRALLDQHGRPCRAARRHRLVLRHL